MRRLAVFIGRLIPGVRSLISIPAGLRGMKMPVFLALTLAGTLVWNTLLAGTGYMLGSNWREVLVFLDSYERILLVAIAALLVIFVARRLRNPPERSRC